MEGTERFLTQFKMPKKEIAKLRKKFKEEQDDAKPPKDEKELQNFTALSSEIFDFFEEISGKRANRELVKNHLEFWFDEGYSPPEIKSYIRVQMGSDYYKQNPEMFTIARLFPIRDPEKITIVWDLLSYELSRVEAGEQKKKESRADLLSKIALRSEPEEIDCLINPYDSMPKVTTDELRELCWFFMRHNQESLHDYAARTEDRRLQIYQKHGIRGGNPLNILDGIR